MSKQISWKLKSWRHEQKLSQAAAGALVGIGRRAWHQIENGHSIPGELVIGRIYVATKAWVEPNDYYDLPLIEDRRKAA